MQRLAEETIKNLNLSHELSVRMIIRINGGIWILGFWHKGDKARDVTFKIPEEATEDNIRKLIGIQILTHLPDW
ncbi:hypothetical protein MYX84_05955 [Acidobacteria bacterium AH-259-O06]|nr:hypothetical protein [Acidobacteria bacterium AH-259-O06]